MLRSVYSMTRLLPAYSLFNKKGYSYCLEYRLFLSLKNQNKFPLVHTSKINLSNSDIWNLSINTEYINKTDLFQLEESYHKKTLELLISNRTKQRPRCFSLTNASNNPLFEVFTFDSGQQVINEDYFSDKRKGKNDLNISTAPSQIKHVDDNISFQSELDSFNLKNNPLCTHYVNTEPSPNEIEIHLSNDEGRKCSIISDTLDEFPDLKHKKTIGNNTSESTIKKLMKTSDTSSSFGSENSFELEIEGDDLFHQVRKENDFIVNSNVADTEAILSRFKNMKKQIKTRTRLNTYKLTEIFMTVLKSKY